MVSLLFTFTTVDSIDYKETKFAVATFPVEEGKLWITAGYNYVVSYYDYAWLTEL